MQAAMIGIFLVSFFLQLACTVYAVGEGQPALIIVSLDGMDWRIQQRDIVNTPNFNFITDTGVRAEYLRNVIPSETWPNHHTILTGLFPESHGIVANTFWDPVYEEMFIFGYDCSNFDPKFYNDSEPIWLTLQKQGGRSASYFWPAITSYAEKPTYYEKETCLVDCNAINSKDLPRYRNRTLPGFPPYVHCVFDLRKPWPDRVNKTIEWLLLDDPPQFIALYFEEPDNTGHRHGPSSPEYKDMVERVDRDAVGLLLTKLRESDLLDKVNLIFVSDHGMDNSSLSRQIYLERYINSSAYLLSHDGPMAHIWPHPGMNDEIYENLTKNPIPHIRKVFRKDDIPQDYHWKNNRRIPPIFIDPEVGWVVVRSESDPLTDRGSHGWPPDESKSYSIFYARGPAFKKKAVMDPFDTVDLYPLMCKLLGITPRPNNGSLKNVEAIFEEEKIQVNKAIHCFGCSYLGLIMMLVVVGLFGV